MIFLDYLYNLPNSTKGIDDIIIETTSAFPQLVSMLLFFVFLIIFIGGITNQKLRTGTADYPVWSLIASISILFLALLFSVSVGFMQLDLLIIVVTLNIFSALWFFLDKKPSEI